MWILWGRVRDGHKTEDYRVAKFTSKKKAEEYIKKSKLKNPTYYEKFKKESLLWVYEEAWVEIQEDTDRLVINPKI